MLIAMAGLPGTGKTAVAEELARVLPAVHLDKDRIRTALFPPDEIEHSLTQDDFCFKIILQTAAYLLQKGRTVIIDGRPFSKSYQIQDMVKFAGTLHIPLKMIQCTCPDPIVKRRLESDLATKKHQAANRNFPMYLKMKEQADPIFVQRLVLSTDRPLSECVFLCVDYIQRNPEVIA